MNIREFIDMVSETKTNKFDKNNPFLATRLKEDVRPASAVIDQAVERLTDEIASGNSYGALEMVRIELHGHEYDDDESDDDHWRREFDGNSDKDKTELERSDIQGWATDRVNDAYYNIAHLFKGGKIRCWRVITVPKGWDISQQHPGMYWSWEKSAAQAHWGDFSEGRSQVIIEALIPLSSIDWVGTLAMNGHPDYEDEKELRIFEDAPVEIVGVKAHN